MSPKRFYCYVDETGQDTRGYLFIVTVVIPENRDEVLEYLESVDALGEKDRRYYGSELHKLGIPSRQVKGVRRDESNALIRLADSVCGFIRDVIEDKPKKEDEKLALVYKKAIKEDVLIEV